MKDKKQTREFELLSKIDKLENKIEQQNDNFKMLMLAYILSLISFIGLLFVMRFLWK